MTISNVNVDSDTPRTPRRGSTVYSENSERDAWTLALSSAMVRIVSDDEEQMFWNDEHPIACAALNHFYF